MFSDVEKFLSFPLLHIYNATLYPPRNTIGHYKKALQKNKNEIECAHTKQKFSAYTILINQFHTAKINLYIRRSMIKGLLVQSIKE
jgi:hypothetical protein